MSFREDNTCFNLKIYFWKVYTCFAFNSRRKRELGAISNVLKTFVRFTTFDQIIVYCHFIWWFELTTNTAKMPRIMIKGGVWRNTEVRFADTRKSLHDNAMVGGWRDGNELY